MKDVEHTFVAFCVQGLSTCSTLRCVLLGSFGTMVGFFLIKLARKVLKK